MADLFQVNPPKDADSADGTHEQKIWSQFAEARRDRTQYDMGWFVAWQWYHGKTDVFLDQFGGRGPQVIRAKRSTQAARRVRPLNLVGHAIDIRTSKQMKARPVFDAAPNSSEQSDMLAARAARDWVRWHWDVSELTSRRHMIYLNRNNVGNGFAKTFYDPFAGPLVANMEECPQCEAKGYMNPEVEGAPFGPEQTCPTCQGHAQVQVGERRLGEVSTVPVSPWEIYPAPGATCVEDADYIFHSYQLSKEAAAAKYGLDAEDIGNASSLEEGESEFARLAQQNRRPDEDNGKVWVIEKYEPPAPNSAQPRLSILVGDKLVWPEPDSEEAKKGEGKPMKSKFGRIPIWHFKLRPVPGQFWALGNVFDMIAANDTVNRVRASLYKHIKSMAHLKWMVEEGSVSAKAINNEEGEVVSYRGVNAPRQSTLSPMPEYVLRTLNEELEHVYRMGGISDIERGVVPPNVEAAQAFSILIEQSETSHGPVLLNDEYEWRQCAKGALQCALANYKDGEERIVRVTGEGGEVEARALTKANLEDNVDIRVEIGSALVHSLALRRADVLAYAERGLIEPDRALELAEFGRPGGEWTDDRRLQESVAQNENDLMAQGQDHMAMMTHGVDDHRIHAMLHRKAALNALTRGDKQAGDMFAQAALAHEQQLAAAQAPPPGAPPGGGGGPPQPLQGIPPDIGQPPDIQAALAGQPITQPGAMG